MCSKMLHIQTRDNSGQHLGILQFYISVQMGSVRKIIVPDSMLLIM